MRNRRNHSIDKLVLDAAQKDIPALSRPFAALGAAIGVPEDEVLRVLKAYKKKGVIRRIGGSFETRRLGFSSTLAGMRVKPGRLAAVAREISKLPGVTHCYERAGDINLWFTLGLRGPMAEVNRKLAAFGRLPGVEKCYSFPVKKMFKIKTMFPI
ncbi:MAG: Lrp/AsnC family transcriptional regulator [Elusimicrobia bacterium]|nr:Lrp/AsnC family transcriptional regulator [Elusimicrobiota bacterium]